MMQGQCQQAAESAAGLPSGYAEQDLLLLHRSAGKCISCNLLASASALLQFAQALLPNVSLPNKEVAATTVRSMMVIA